MFPCSFDEAERERWNKNHGIVRIFWNINSTKMNIGNSMNISKMISVSHHLQSSPSSCEDRVEAMADDCRRIAWLLAEDLISSRTLENSQPAVNRHAVTLRRTVSEVSHKHPIVFSSIVKRLGPLDEDSLPGVFNNVCREMLNDGQLNWGRVVSLFAFAAALAQHFSTSHQHLHLVPTVTHLLAEYISDHLTSWIVKQGGWDAFDRYFPEPNGVENSIWKGLLCTFVGLGALASVVAAR